MAVATERLPQIGVRVEPAFREQIREMADRYHGGNESLLLREAGRVYIALRQRLGVQYEPTLALLIGPEPAAAGEPR